MVFSCILVLSSIVVLGHGNEKHDSTAKIQANISQTDTLENKVFRGSEASGEVEIKYNAGEQKLTASLDDFPNLHPLIVHFAIVLILFGALLQLVQVVVLRKEVAWIAFLLVFTGTITAYFAGEIFHPHTHGLSEHAKKVLEQHDYWADMTINFGIFGTILQFVNLFVWQQKRWAIVVVFVLLSIAAYSVVKAGHYGAQLVHIEGVGPQWKYLETQREHDH